MKKLIIFAAVIINCQLSIVNCYAQSPNAIPYQAVARNSSGNIIASQNISLRFSIHDNTANGTIVYQEIQSVTTNALGLFTCTIGMGQSMIGNFSAVIWSVGNKFTQVEMDITGGTNYTDMGTSQMLSVPYALYALTSGNGAGSTGATGATGANGNNGTNGTNGTDGATGATGAPGSTNGWSLTGNAGTNASTDFIGTTDAAALNFRANNVTAGRIDPTNYSVYFGSQSGNVSGYSPFNTAVGHQALLTNTIGSNNAAFGGGALSSNVTGYKNTAIGCFADVTINNLTNATAIGYNAKVATDNSMVLGGTGTDAVNVGIGTTSPASPLSFANAVGDKINFYNTSATQNYGIGLQGGLLQLHTDLAASDIAFGYGNSGAMIETMRIKGNGNVGIGTNTPGYKLDVTDRMRIRQGAAGTAGIWFYQTTGADRAFAGMMDDNNVGLYGNAGGTWGLVMNTTSGNTGINNVSPSEKLDVGGNVKFSGALMPNNTAGTAGQVLQSNGAGAAPTWVNPSSGGSQYNNIHTYIQSTNGSILNFGGTCCEAVPGLVENSLVLSSPSKVIISVSVLVQNMGPINPADYDINLRIFNNNPPFGFVDGMIVYDNSTANRLQNTSFTKVFTLPAGNYLFETRLEGSAASGFSGVRALVNGSQYQTSVMSIEVVPQ